LPINKKASQMQGFKSEAHSLLVYS